MVESYVRSNGINAFYESLALRKACCFMRKVEPLQRALSNKKAWITGMRAEQSATRVDLPDTGLGLLDAPSDQRPELGMDRRLDR